MTGPTTDPLDDVPERIATALEDCDDGELRAVIEYAQRRLQDNPSLTEEIESRPGEELVRIEDHGAYTLVVVERPEETGAAQGPFAYRVTWESDIDDEEGRYRWHYLGKVHDNGGP
jgi:hypothetical protein